MHKFLLSLLTSLSIVSTTAFAMDEMPEGQKNPLARKLIPDLQGYLSSYLTGNDIHCLSQTCQENHRIYSPLIHHLDFSKDTEDKKLRSLKKFLRTSETESPFSQLCHLTSLNLSFHPTFPFDELTRITNLECLNLRMPSCKVEHPNLDAVLNCLTSLKSLDVRYLLNITNTGICGLTNLRFLNISGLTYDDALNASVGLVTGESICELTNLKSLTCVNNAANSAIEGRYISYLTKLEELSFDTYGIVSNADLKNLPVLNTLSLHERKNDLSLEGLSNIQRLSLFSSNMSPLSNLSNLKVLRLDVAADSWTDQVLSQYTALTALELPVSRGTSKKALSALTNLTYLNLLNSRIRTKALKLPKLETFIMGHCHDIDFLKHDSIYKEWAAFPTLKKLVIAYPSSDDPSEQYTLRAVALESLPNLQELITYNVELSGDAKDCLSSKGVVHKVAKNANSFPPLPSVN